MELIVDECIAESTKTLLKEFYFKLLEIEDILRVSATDEEIYNYALERNIALITHDRGMGEIYHKSKKNPPLTIVLQMVSPHPKATNDLLLKSLKQLKIKEDNYHNNSLSLKLEQ